jgi:hypothetical protein
MLAGYRDDSKTLCSIINTVSESITTSNDSNNIILQNNFEKSAIIHATGIKIPVAKPIIADADNKLSLLNTSTQVALNSARTRDPVTNMLNTVVQNPKTDCVTFEIDEQLVGRYVADDLVYMIDNGKKTVLGELFFEIKCDGSAEISLATFDGIAHYCSKDILLTLFYGSDGIVVINFNLVGGKFTFPSTYGLSVCLKGDSSFASFKMSESPQPKYSKKYIKQDPT